MNKGPVIQHPLKPVIDRSAVVLILGSMPGAASLAAREYYAHPQNQFWEIMEQITGVDRRTDYEDRLLALKQRGIALWDVIASCERSGSLDSAIRASSVTLNPIASLLRDHPAIRTICFNGRAAEQYFRRHILERHPEVGERIKLVSLPSTSPAHAGISRSAKCATWLEALRRSGIRPAKGTKSRLLRANMNETDYKR